MDIEATLSQDPSKVLVDVAMDRDRVSIDLPGALECVTSVDFDPDEARKAAEAMLCAADCIDGTVGSWPDFYKLHPDICQSMRFNPASAMRELESIRMRLCLLEYYLHDLGVHVHLSGEADADRELQSCSRRLQKAADDLYEIKGDAIRALHPIVCRHNDDIREQIRMMKDLKPELVKVLEKHLW